MSIRRKLVLALLAGLALVGVAASGLTWLQVRSEANALFDYQLQQMALSLRDQAPRGPAALFAEVEYDYIVQVWEPSGGIVYLSNRNILLPQSGNGFDTATLDGEDWRIFTLVRPDKIVQVAAPLRLRHDRASAMALRILVPILVSIPLFGVLIWLLVGYELRPLNRIAGAIRRRQPGSLDALPDAALPEEVRPLVAELNALLVRLREALEAQKRFTADAAHELRSPLAALQVQIDLVERASSEPERSAALAALRGGTLRASRLVEQMLTLARLDPQAPLEPVAPVELDRIATEVVAELEPLAEQKKVAVRLDRLAPTRVMGRVKDLQALARNLVDNAIRYTPGGGAVSVSAYADEQGAHLEVRDTGAGIPAGERSRVLDRFYRLDDGAGQGSGLGLSIVKRIADAHGATLELADGPGGRGLAVHVRFS